MEKFEIDKCPLEGSNLIEASAGTGKTYAITGLYLRLILEKKLSVENILVVTYTVAATEELRGRIRKMLREAHLILSREDHAGDNDSMLHKIISGVKNRNEAAAIVREAVINFDRASISTIHSFCQGMLLENAFESGSMYNTELITDNSELLNMAVDDYWRKHIATASKIVYTYLMDSRINRSYLLDLARSRGADTGIKIVPEIIKPSTDEAENKFMMIFNNIKETWDSDSESIKDIISNDKSISRGKYRGNTIKKLVQDTGLFLSGNNPMDIPANFEKFSHEVISESINKGCSVPGHVFFKQVDDFYIILDDLQKILDDYTRFLKSQMLNYVHQELDNFNHRYNTRSYDDLIRDMESSLKGSSDSPLSRAVREKYRAALIDEFQDTDPVQYRIFYTLFSKDSILFLIGDPKQAIYSFRGGDIFAYMNALRRVDRKYTLGINWRSHRDLVYACNAIFSNNENPFLYKEIQFKKVEAPERDYHTLELDGEKAPVFNLCFLKNSTLEQEESKFTGKGEAEDIIARSVAMEIYRLVKMGSSGRAVLGDKVLKPEDIAVLVRKRHQAKMIQDYLSHLGIPGTLYGTDSVFRTEEARDIKYLLSAVAEPSSDRSIKTALSTRIIGYSGSEIYNSYKDENSWNIIINRFQEYHRLWTTGDFITMFNTLLIRENVRSRILSSDDGERCMTNILHISELLHRAEMTDKAGPRGLIKWLSVKIASDSGDENQLRLESDENAVSLITIHRSKGLEFPVVFCPYTWEGVRTRDNSEAFKFHETTGTNQSVLDLGTGSRENLESARKEELAENIRLLYVSLTRAKNTCYFYWGRINKTGTSAPAYILHGEDISEDDPVNSTEECLNRLGSDTMYKQLEKLADRSKGLINIQAVEFQETAGNYKRKIDSKNLACREFMGSIDTGWKISSYSSITSSRHTAYHELDRDLPDITHAGGENVKQFNMFTFPRGTRAGSLLHEVLEQADFTRPDSPENLHLVKSILLKYRFSGDWALTVADCLEKVSEINLDRDVPQLALKNINRKDMLNEIEFCFPVQSLTPNQVGKILSGIKIGGEHNITGLNFQKCRGFLKGFIDMVFKHDNRYYILDWKSNHLGNLFDDYSFNSLAKEMNVNLYTLQYYLYTLALHRYLSLTDPDYYYDESFGSVFYIFLRGLNKQNSNGIFSHRPDFEEIARMEKIIIGSSIK